MAMTWAELTAGKDSTGSIASWVNSDKIPAADVIADSENYLNRHLRVRRLHKRANITLTTGADQIALIDAGVTDFLDHVRLYRRGYGELVWVPEAQIDPLREEAVGGAVADTGAVYFTIINDTILFDRGSAAGDTLVLTYFAEPPALSASQTTNLYTTEFRGLFKDVLMGHGYLFLKDETRTAAMLELAAAKMKRLTDVDAMTGPEVNAASSDMTYSTLIGPQSRTGSIRSWVQTEVPSAEIIAETENWLAQRMRVNLMLTRTELVLQEGDSTLVLSSVLPAFLDPVHVYLRGYGEVHNIHEDELERVRVAEEGGSLSESTPSYYALIGRTMYFDCLADQDYTVIVTHYARPTALSASNQTNIYTTDYRAMYKMALTGFAHAAAGDHKLAAAFLQGAQQQIQEILIASDLVRRTQVYDYGAA